MKKEHNKKAAITTMKHHLEMGCQLKIRTRYKEHTICSILETGCLAESSYCFYKKAKSFRRIA